MDFFYYFSRNQHIRNYKKRYSDFKEENHCRPVLLLKQRVQTRELSLETTPTQFYKKNFRKEKLQQN